jgi:hypothetical protein
MYVWFHVDALVCVCVCVCVLACVCVYVCVYVCLCVVCVYDTYAYTSAQGVVMPEGMWV